MVKRELLTQRVAWLGQTKNVMGGFPSLVSDQRSALIWIWKCIQKKIPQAKHAVPQTPQFTTNLSPPHELLAVMEVLNELGFLEERRHAPHVKPIIKT